MWTEVSNFSDLSVEIAKIESDQLLVLWDSKVLEIYKDKISLPEHCISLEVGSGEEIKTLENYSHIVESCLKYNLHRNCHVLAIGGGALSDFAGFIAATLLRGMNWSIVPTTLLSMVDASIGGKTGINSNSGKNLIGAFHFPKNIFFCEKFKKTLKEVEISSGYGEILKYAFIDKEVYRNLLDRGFDANIISQCASIKNEIVLRDPNEKSQRKILNLGHTFGHAFEKKFELPHGIAVSHGLYLIFKCFNGPLEEYLSLCHQLKIDINPDLKLNHQDIVRFVFKDKKRKNKNEIELVLCSQVGKVEVKAFDEEQILRRIL
jgi:3-dehydroquinate synthase